LLPIRQPVSAVLPRYPSRPYCRATRLSRRSASSPVLRPPRRAAPTVVSGAVFFIMHSWSSLTGWRS